MYSKLTQPLLHQFGFLKIFLIDFIFSGKINLFRLTLSFKTLGSCFQSAGNKQTFIPRVYDTIFQTDSICTSELPSFPILTKIQKRVKSTYAIETGKKVSALKPLIDSSSRNQMQLCAFITSCVTQHYYSSSHQYYSSDVCLSPCFLFQ